MPGIPHLSRKQNRLYARLRKVLIKSGKYTSEGGDDMATNKKSEVQTMTVAAMAHTLEETIPIENSNAVARHGNNFVRLVENVFKTKVFNAKERRRKAAVKRLNEIQNAE